MAKHQSPVIVELDDENLPSPAEVESDFGDEIQADAPVKSGLPGRFARGALAAFVALIGMYVSYTLWEFVAMLWARTPVMAYIAMGLIVIVGFAVLVLALRELAGLYRLRRIGHIREHGKTVRETNNLRTARRVMDDMIRLYQGRPELRSSCRNLRQIGKNDIHDADAILDLCEKELLQRQDREAQILIGATVRRVATLTAMIPMAGLDAVVVMIVNLRMIRRIAQIYGGYLGVIALWRLVGMIVGHMAAAGMIAIGDDLISSLTGAGLASKLSRRFGEGVVNGALSARIGLAAMDVCRPLEFHTEPRPKVRNLLQQALTGIFDPKR